MLLKIYGVIALVLMALGFAGLLDLPVPIVSTEIVPALQRHAVWGETLRGPAVLVRGQDWFFLIVFGLVIVLGILTLLFNRWIQSSSANRLPQPKKGRKRQR